MGEACDPVKIPLNTTSPNHIPNEYNGKNHNRPDAVHECHAHRAGGANVKGKPNYMTAAWATVACMAPPMVCVAINKVRYTAKGIEENKTFSLNVPSENQVVETDHCGLVSGVNEDKTGVFRSFYGKLKTAPMAEECPVNIECRLFKSVECGSHLLYIGEVMEIHADRSCLTDGKPDVEKINPIVYAQMNYFGVGKTG